MTVCYHLYLSLFTFLTIYVALTLCILKLKVLGNVGIWTRCFFLVEPFYYKANPKKADIYFGVLFNSNYEFDQVGISFIYMYILIFYRVVHTLTQLRNSLSPLTFK